MTADVDVAIIGAGPYGLSVGAHLQSKNIDYVVFGQPMQTWSSSMPQGMHLKSDGFASNLSDPENIYPLKTFCNEQKIPFSDLGHPMVALETFISYGCSFQSRYVDKLDERWVSSIRRGEQGFEISTSDDETITAHRVVMAVGITNFSYVPEVFRKLPPDLCTHSSRHSDLSMFAGSRVAVIGGGSSAADVSATLHQVGSNVELIARKDRVTFHSAMRVPRPLHHRIKAPTSGLGPGWRLRFYADAAPIFHMLPESYRITEVRNALGPAGGWFTRDKVVGKVPMIVGSSVEWARANDNVVMLGIRRPDGELVESEYDHVITATGYRPRLDRIDLLDPSIVEEITTAAGTPILSRHFESSVNGLFFIGPIAANSFGPLMKFAFGSRFAARTVTRHLAAHSPT